ncbi:MAG: hypothetical protein U0270_06245 [Labilithrix sp.]
MNIKQLAVCMGVALTVVACGDDEADKPAPEIATVDNAAAKSSATATITALASTVNGSENGASVGALSAAAQSSQSLLSAQPAAGTRSVAQGLGLDTESIHVLDIGDPGCSCTATSCTFNACSFGATNNNGSVSFTIDGSYSWGGGHVVCSDLKYTFSGNNLGGGTLSTNTVVTLNCDLTVTDSSIDGFVQSSGSTSTNLGQNAYSSTWDVRSTYHRVTFDRTTHQATGGSLTVNGTATTTAGGQTRQYAGSGEVTFP